MIKKQCILTGEFFEAENPEEVISPNTKDGIIKALSRSDNFRQEVISAIVQDQECRNSLASAIMNTPVDEIGIPAPGTIAEFFRKYQSRYNRTPTRKAAKKVRKSDRQSS